MSKEPLHWLTPLPLCHQMKQDARYLILRSQILLGFFVTEAPASTLIHLRVTRCQRAVSSLEPEKVAVNSGVPSGLSTPGISGGAELLAGLTARATAAGLHD
jgi:hypothetical protein